MTTSRGHDEGALHSRAIEKSMAAAKKAKTITRWRILPYGAPDSLVAQGPIGGVKWVRAG